MAVGCSGLDDSLRRVAVVQDGRVLLYRLSAEGLIADVELEGFKYPAVSVAFADFNGDGGRRLVGGLSGTGNRLCLQPVGRIFDLGSDGSIHVVSCRKAAHS